VQRAERKSKIRYLCGKDFTLGRKVPLLSIGAAGKKMWGSLERTSAQGDLLDEERKGL